MQCNDNSKNKDPDKEKLDVSDLLIQNALVLNARDRSRGVSPLQFHFAALNELEMIVKQRIALGLLFATLLLLRFSGVIAAVVREQ
jgi:hypothetical protein